MKKIWVTNREQGAEGMSVDCFVRVSRNIQTAISAGLSQ